MEATVLSRGEDTETLQREDRVTTANLWEWRHSVLEAALIGLTDPQLPQLQRRGGVWRWNEQIPYPGMEDVAILDTGCLKFEVDCGGQVLLFSVWLQVGEVRIGVKVPNVLILGGGLREKILRAYDGQQCQRSEVIGECVLCDWIWKDREFAEFTFMVRSLRDPMLASVIADRIVNVVIHLYLSVLNTLIDAHGFKVGFRRISRVPLKGTLFLIQGDPAAFKWLVAQRGYTVDKEVKRADRATVMLVLRPEKGVPLPESGRIREPDGAECLILAAQPAKADGGEIDWERGIANV